MSVWKSKERDYWIAKFQHRGKQVKREGFKSRSEAQEWEVRQRQRLNRAMTPSIFFQELATEYLRHCQSRMVLGTIKQKAFVYRSFLAFIGGDVPVASITAKQISDYLNSRTRISNKTANRDLKEIKALFNWGITQEIVDCKNPCRHMQSLPETPHHPYVPPPEDIDKVRLVCDRNERDFIECIYHLMARRSEIMRLTWRDVNLEQRWVRLYTRKRRGGDLQEDYMPMNQTLYDILMARWKKRDKESQYVFSFDINQLDYMMEKLCRNAGVKSFGLHAIRHHVASILNDSKKASMKQLQILLRHRRQSTTETYLHQIEGSLHQVVSFLDGKAFIGHHDCVSGRVKGSTIRGKG